jgi:hypothetical protein
MEIARKIRIHRAATTSREYDAITVVIADLHLRCDLVCDRQIRLANALAESHGIPLTVDDTLAERVRKALHREKND